MGVWGYKRIEGGGSSSLTPPPPQKKRYRKVLAIMKVVGVTKRVQKMGVEHDKFGRKAGSVENISQFVAPLPVINGQFLKEPNKYDWIQKHLYENLHPIWVTTIKVDFT